MKNFDHYAMQMAIEQAFIAKKKGFIPVGAILTTANKIIKKAHNIDRYHAEFLLLQQCKIYDSCNLYVTLEPCALCSGLIAHSRIKKLFFGAYSPKTGCVDHNTKNFEHSHHKIEIIGGFMEKECQKIIKNMLK